MYACLSYEAEKYWKVIGIYFYDIENLIREITNLFLEFFGSFLSLFTAIDTGHYSWVNPKNRNEFQRTRRL